MPELMIDFITSLDGYGAAKDWLGLWGLQGPKYLAWLDEDAKRNATLLMGANTYRLMSEMQGQNSDEDASLAQMSKTQKVVFSSISQSPLSWANTRLVSGDAVEAVKQMKQESGSPLTTVGSLSLCRSLLKAGLVDRLRVVVFPVITGSTGYDRIYDGYPDVALDLVSSQLFDGSIQLLEYTPKLLDKPPGANNGLS